MKIIRLNENDIEKLVGKIINEFYLFGKAKLTPDERIANYILEKLEKERPDIQHQFVSHEFNIIDFMGITPIFTSVNSRGVLEGDLFIVDFTNKSARITKNTNGILTGGDFAIAKVYNVHYKSDLGQRRNNIGYTIRMTGDDKPLDIPKSLVRRIYDKVESQYGDIRVFKAQRRIDKGIDDADDLFDQLGQ